MHINVILSVIIAIKIIIVEMFYLISFQKTIFYRLIFTIEQINKTIRHPLLKLVFEYVTIIKKDDCVILSNVCLVKNLIHKIKNILEIE